MQDSPGARVRGVKPKHVGHLGQSKGRFKGWIYTAGPRGQFGFIYGIYGTISLTFQVTKCISNKAVSINWIRLQLPSPL